MPRYHAALWRWLHSTTRHHNGPLPKTNSRHAANRLYLLWACWPFETNPVGGAADIKAVIKPPFLEWILAPGFYALAS
jgi:hypothetical protein